MTIKDYELLRIKVKDFVMVKDFIKNIFFLFSLK
jgi:hypothetical protein